MSHVTIQVRAAAVYALGTYILNNSDDGRHSNHAINIEHTVVAMLLPVATDGSPLVRQVCPSIKTHTERSGLGTGPLNTRYGATIRERVSNSSAQVL